ncbi:MAG: TolC family protein [Syntrophales bacterium]
MAPHFQKLLFAALIIVAISAYPVPVTQVVAQDTIPNSTSETGTGTVQNKSFLSPSRNNKHDQKGYAPATKDKDIQVSLSLKTCLKYALTDNPLIAEARLGVQAGGKLVESASGRHYPKLSIDSNYTKRQDPFPYIPAQSNTISPHFSDEFASWQFLLTLPLYQGGQIINGVKLAEVRKLIQEDNLTLTRNELIVNVVNTYNKILQLRKLREASQSSVTALDNQLQNAQLLFKVGRVAKIDLLKVDVQLANEKQRLLSLDQAIEVSSETLQYLMNRQSHGPPEPLTLADELRTEEFTPDTAKAMERAKEKRPEYLLATRAVEDAKLTRSIITGKLLPSVGAFAGYGDQYGFRPAYDEANWIAGVNLNMFLFDKSLYADIARERLLEDKALKHLQTVENQLRLEIQSALSAIKESRNRVLTSGQVVDQAQESFRIEEFRYKSGAGAVVDMLLAEAAYVTAAANYSQSLFDYNAAVVAYRKATGALEDYLQ